ncbi:MAG TPA: NAD-dependent succinate-semialdehyde dehydrogenase [Vulgatibacter sp.]|nr:NAD-dependent succinate-semialdehyde dehydrogenase [Vulgatibacter sp.]
MGIATINPATGERLRTFEELDDAALERKLALAAEAFSHWRRTSFSRRAESMARAAEQLTGDRERLARLMVVEMGKPIAAARAEVDKCAWVCRHYAEHAERLLADEPVDVGDARAYVRHLPLGPVLAVMPWNFPFWQVFRFAAPGLMAGNVGLLKHASNVPQCALAIEEVLLRAGFPEGVFQTLLIGHRKAAQVLEDPRVVAATLTGSGPAGSSVASLAGKRIKKTVLELGGSDPFVVMPSADLDAAAKTAVAARNVNSGQSCIAAKRFIVHRDVYGAFQERFLAELSKVKVGDPLSEETTVGPLATESIRDGVAEQVEDAVRRGARLLAGGTSVGTSGWFYAPTVLADVPEDARAFTEEVFGPVALLFQVADLDEAIALANATEFGLGSSVWTRDASEVERFVNEIEAGMTFVNSMVVSDPRLPFGGVKSSGYGRELARDGILEFVNRKAVSIAGPKPTARSTIE